MSANLPLSSINIHCLRFLVHPPLVRLISKLMFLVLNFVSTDTNLFLMKEGFLPENIISNRLLAMMSSFCFITYSSSLANRLTNFRAFSITGNWFGFSTFKRSAISSTPKNQKGIFKSSYSLVFKFVVYTL